MATDAIYVDEKGTQLTIVRLRIRRTFHLPRQTLRMAIDLEVGVVDFGRAATELSTRTVINGDADLVIVALRGRFFLVNVCAAAPSREPTLEC